jgi:hypothetical protein
MIRIEEVPASKGAAYLISDAQGPICTVGFFITSLISRLALVDFEPHRMLRAQELRELRRLWFESIDVSLFCNVLTPRTERFASFFGFRRVALVDNIIVMERIL